MQDEKAVGWIKNSCAICTTSITYNLPERGGDMPDFDMRKVMEVLIALLAEQENVDIDYEFVSAAKEKAG